MADPVLPENVNNDDADFLFQKKLYQGAGAAQYEVRERFEKNESGLAELAGKQSSSESSATELKGRVDTLESNQQTLTNDQAGLSNLLSEQRGKLDGHIDDDAVHVPDAGQDRDVLTVGDDNKPVWKNFDTLLPAAIWEIIANGGNVTPEQVIDAFREITVSAWTLSGQPFGATRIKAATFVQDRFIVGASNGGVSCTFDAKTWNPVSILFSEPNPAAVESIAHAVTMDGKTPVLALDAYSDFCISLDRATWSRRLSVRVEKNENGTYKDRYSTADFTKALADRNLFLLFTTSGEVYRATYQEVVDEFERIANPNEERHSTVWKLQESNFSITQGVLDAASGANQFITVGSLGRMAISGDGNIWEQISSPFGSSNVNAIAAGEDRFIAVGEDGKIAYALFTNPKSWTLLNAKPFENESIRSIKFGGGIWLAVSASGKVMSSKTGMTWNEVPANMTGGGTCIAFGDTYFLVGDTNGSLIRSISVASIFTVVTRSEFAAFVQEQLNWSAAETAKLLSFVNNQLARIDLALANQAHVIEFNGLASSLGGSAGSWQIQGVDENGEPLEDEDGNPIMVPQRQILAFDHRHDNSNTVLMSQLNRESYEAPPSDDPVHWQGIPILDKYGKIFAKNQTWQRGEANGLAPLDADRLVPPEYLANGWGFQLLMQEIRAQMLTYWNLQPVKIFQDLGEYSRINAIAYNKTTFVAVGEQNRIAWGPTLRTLQMVEDAPFGLNDSIVGVAYGYDHRGIGVFIAVSQTHYSTSVDGSNWTEAVELSTDIQGVFYGGGLFLIPDAAGNVYRSAWTGNDLSFVIQETSPLTTQGVVSIAYLEGRFVGVGKNNLIVGSDDGAFWDTEQSPHDADTQWNHVFAGDGVFVAVGTKGRMAYAQPHQTWVKIQSGTTQDLHTGVYDYECYVVGGKNGTLITSFSVTAWALRNSKTTSTIRAAGYVNNQFVIATDAGQFVASATLADVFGLIGEVAVGPSNDDPKPLGEIADPGIANQFSRGDHVHPWDGLVLTAMMGAPNGVAELDENGKVKNEQLKLGVPNGIAPLDENNLVPEIHIPPIDLEIIIEALKGGVFEMVEAQSPFPQGPTQTAVLLSGASLGSLFFLGGESGIGYSNGGAVWQMLSEQPFENAVAGMAGGLDTNDIPVLVAVDTAKSFSYTLDGTAWEDAVEMTGNYDFSWIDYYNKTFVITSTNGQILRSQWTGSELSFIEQESGPEFTEGIVRTVGGNGQWIGFGNGGKIVHSPDASHFASVASPTTKNLYCAAYGKTYFVAGGEDGALIFGDGSEFEVGEKPFESGADLVALAFIESLGIFIVTNTDGEIAVAENPELPWAKIVSPFAVPIRAIAISDERICIGNDHGEIATSKQVLDITIATSWDKITGKPASFPPSPHSHALAQIGDFPAGSAETQGYVLTYNNGGVVWAAATGGEGVPEPGSNQDGYVLTVVSGLATWAVNPKELPQTGTTGHVLTKTENGVQWMETQDTVGFPDPAEAQNGQVLTSRNNAALWETPSKELPAVGNVGDMLVKTSNGVQWSGDAATYAFFARRTSSPVNGKINVVVVDESLQDTSKTINNVTYLKPSLYE